MNSPIPLKVLVVCIPRRIHAHDGRKFLQGLPAQRDVDQSHEAALPAHEFDEGPVLPAAEDRLDSNRFTATECGLEFILDGVRGIEEGLLQSGSRRIGKASMAALDQERAGMVIRIQKPYPWEQVPDGMGLLMPGRIRRRRVVSKSNRAQAGGGWRRRRAVFPKVALESEK